MPNRMPRLSSRAKAQGKPPEWYHIGAVMALAESDEAPGEDDAGTSTAGTTADVYVYDDIGGWFGLTADDFVRDVAALDVDQIVLHLNTPGGDAMEGVAIANVLRAHKARIIVRVDGIAASAGSVVAMAGDEVIMGIGSELMVHDAWGMVVGNAADITAFGKRLSTTSNALASTYAAKAGGTTEYWRKVMEAETWYTAQEAVDAKLADRVATADEKATAEGEQITPGGSFGGFWDMWDTLKRPDRFDLSMFNYAGRAHAPAPRTQPQEVRDAVAFTDAQLKTMRESLNLPDDADEDAITAAVAAQTPEDDEDAGDEADKAEATPAATETLAPTEGTVTVDAGALATLRAQAARGEQAAARQEREDREAAVAAAIEDGRIPPARREHWLNLLAKDPGAAKSLAELEPGLIPVGQPAGADTAAEVDPLYVSLFGKDG
jgi:ATP-dependent protease ClpP protease subunit